MNFDREELITRVDGIIATRIRENDRRNKKGAEEAAQKLNDWMKKIMPEYQKFAEVIIACASKKVPVTQEDCPKSLRDRYGNGMKFWQEEKFTPQEPNVKELMALRSALSASPDKIISTSGLRELGFRDLNKLFMEGAFR